MSKSEAGLQIVDPRVFELAFRAMHDPVFLAEANALLDQRESERDLCEFKKAELEG